MAQETRLERQFRRQCRICDSIGADRMREILREEVLPDPGWEAFIDFIRGDRA